METETKEIRLNSYTYKVQFLDMIYGIDVEDILTKELVSQLRRDLRRKRSVKRRAKIDNIFN